jgi:hypothetical protein
LGKLAGSDVKVAAEFEGWGVVEDLGEGEMILEGREEYVAFDGLIDVSEKKF